MTLLELCEPLFQYVCRLNRSARKGVHSEMGAVRGELKAILTDMRTKAATQRGLLDQYEKVEIVLMGFVDSMIKTSPLPFATKWQELAHEKDDLTMDERFYDILAETLKDQSEAATERLGIFYTCMGLGFTGWYQGQHEYLRSRMKEIAPRLGIKREGDRPDQDRICPEAYEYVDKRDLVQPPGSSLVGIAIAVLVLGITIIAANVVSYVTESRTLKSSLNQIITKTAAPDAPKAAEPKGANK